MQTEALQTGALKNENALQINTGIFKKLNNNYLGSKYI